VPFAMAELSPFLGRHQVLTIVENLLILGIFCLFLRYVMGPESALWCETDPHLCGQETRFPFRCFALCGGVFACIGGQCLLY